jgi:hypothetical protein
MMGLRNLLNHKQWPVALGILTAVLLAAVASALSLRASAVDPHVTLEEGGVVNSKRATPDLAMARLAAVMNGEVSHTADRLGEAAMLMFSVGGYLGSAGVKGKPPRDVKALVEGIAQNGLMPPGLATTEYAGTLASAWGSVSVRYRPAPLGLELISIASKSEYGPAMIIRLPDETSEKGEAKLYVADRLQGVTVPAPFTPASEVIAMGWSPERFRSRR